MPPVARAKTAALAELLDRLLAEPVGSRGDCVDRIEALAGEIEPDTLYREDELASRLLGHPVSIDDPRALVGAAVLTDLSVLAERLTDESGALAPPGPVLSLDELIERWSVSKKTIDRYRRLGLIARRAHADSGRRRLVFTVGAVELFEARHQPRLVRAGRFRRLGRGEDERLVRRAERYRSRFGWSLNRVAARLAERTGRSHEGIRQLLKRHDARRDSPLFPEPGPPARRERRIAVRAARRGIGPSELAERWGRSKASVRRALNQGRAELLAGLDLGGPHPATFGRGDAPEVLLGPEVVRSALPPAPVPGMPVLELLALARTPEPPVRSVETALAMALHFLRFDVARVVGALSPATAEALEVDRAETRLRWASMIKAVLLRPHLGLIAQTLEARAGAPLEQLGLERLERWWREGIRAASVSVDGFDPGSGGRLAARVGLGVDRAAAALAKRDAPRVPASRRARATLAPGASVGDWTLWLDPWQAHLAPDPRVPAVLGRLDGRSGRVLAMRFGLPGGAGSGSPTEPPMTLDEVAERLGTARVHAARAERRALRAAVEAARDADTISA